MNGRKMLKKLIKRQNATYAILKDGDEEVRLVYSSTINTTNPLVKKGDLVLVGQKIGEAAQDKDVSVYSSVSGTVKSLEESILLNGEKVKVIVINNDKSYTKVEKTLNGNLSKKEKLDNLKESGIIDSLTNLTINELFGNIGNNDSIIIDLSNVFEESRYVSILENKRDSIKNAIKILKEDLKINTKLYLVEGSQELFNKFNSMAAECGVEVVKGKYPYFKASREVIINENNFGKSEFMALETLIHLNDWIEKSESMISQFLTILNSKNNKSITIKASLGSSIKYLIEKQANIDYDIKKVIEKDMLSGKSVYNLLAPLNKITSTLIIFGDNIQEYEENPCIKCGKCYKVCDMKLIPFKLDQHVRKNEQDEFIKYGGKTCIECGLCSYVCPSKRKLMESIVMMKKTSI